MDSAESLTASVQKDPFTSSPLQHSSVVGALFVCVPFSHFQSEFHYVPVCMEIFSIISTLFFLAVVWISEWPRQKQTALMISNPLCAISFVWCFVSFPFFMHLHKSSTFIRVERIARKKSWRRPSVHGDRLNPSYFILCVCSMMFNFRFWSFHPFDTVYGQESRRAHHKTTKWLCWWKPRVPHTLDGVGLVPEWMCTLTWKAWLTQKQVQLTFAIFQEEIRSSIWMCMCTNMNASQRNEEI